MHHGETTYGIEPQEIYAFHNYATLVVQYEYRTSS